MKFKTLPFKFYPFKTITKVKQQKNFRLRGSFTVFALCLGMLLLAVIAYRAYTLSITYDEVFCHELASQSIHDILFAPHNFQSANNHVLNTLLIKCSLVFFPHKEWVLRLPNVLSFILFFVSAYFLVKQLTQVLALRYIALLIICINAYLLDFFSLARGYGLANSFEMASLSCLFLYMKYERRKYTILTFFFLSLAVLSNFTWINFYLPAWFCMNLFFYVKDKKNFLSNILRFNIVPFFFTLLLATYCYTPLQYLLASKEFQWGANAWFDSFHTYTKNMNYHDTRIGAVLTQILLMVIFCIGCLVIFNSKGIKLALMPLLRFILLLISAIIVLSIAQRLLFGIYYMDARKATMYSVLIASMFILLIDYFLVQHNKVAWVLAAISLGYAILPVMLFFKINTVREWESDTSTKTICKFLMQHENRKEVNILASHQFISAFSYYNKYMLENKINLYNTDTALLTKYYLHYYYLNQSDLEVVKRTVRLLPCLHQDIPFYKGR